jgi:ketosteroid isomerase-like protein
MAVSRDNVEIVRHAYAAAFRKPKPDFATVNALYHPDHELVTPLSRLEGTTYSGAAGFREWFRSRADDWDSVTFRLHEAVEIDDSRVLLAATFQGRGKRAGVPIEQLQGFVVTVRDGKVVRTEAYSTVDEARAAGGLPARTLS